MMKSISECAKLTGLTYSAIRRFILAGKVKYIRVGVKYYVNYNSLLELCGEEL